MVAVSGGGCGFDLGTEELHENCCLIDYRVTMGKNYGLNGYGDIRGQ